MLAETHLTSPSRRCRLLSLIWRFYVHFGDIMKSLHSFVFAALLILASACVVGARAKPSPGRVVGFKALMPSRVVGPPRAI